MGRVCAAFEFVRKRRSDMAAGFDRQGGAEIDRNRVVDTFDLRGPLITLWSHRNLILACAALLTMAAIAITSLMTPTFTGLARVSLETRSTNYTNIKDVVSGLPVEDATIGSEIGIMGSNRILMRVARGLRLDLDPEFNPNFTDVATSEMLNTEPQITDLILAYLRRSVWIRQSGNSFIIDVGATSTEPTKAALIANAVTNVYLQEQLEEKNKIGTRATKWLELRLENLSGELAAAKEAVQEHQTLQLRKYGESRDVTEARLDETGLQFARAQADRVNAQSRFERMESLARTPEGLSGLPEVVQSSLISRLQEQVVELKNSEANLLTRYGNRHPEIISLRAEISNLTAAIAAEKNRIADSIRNNFETASDFESSLANVMNSLEEKLLSQDTELTELRRLEANVEAVQTLYESFLARYREASETVTLVTPDSRIISEARPPQLPSGPSKRLIILMSTVLGLGLGAMLALLLEAFKNSFRTPAQLEHALKIPHLGSLPLVTDKIWMTDPTRPIQTEEHYLVKESLRDIRTGLALENNNARVIAVSSSHSGEGKSTVSVLLGSVMAEIGTRVLVIGADLRRPILTRWIAPKSKFGLGTVLKGTSTLNNSIVRARSGFDFLPAGSENEIPANLLMSSRMEQTFSELREMYDYVIVDLPPVLNINDTRVFARHVDAIMFVVRWNKTSKGAAVEALSKLRHQNYNVIGAVFNGVDAAQRLYYGVDDTPFSYMSPTTQAAQ